MYELKDIATIRNNMEFIALEKRAVDAQNDAYAALKEIQKRFPMSGRHWGIMMDDTVFPLRLEDEQ